MDINRIYTVYNTSDVNDVPIQKITNYIRYSVDNSQLIVEWTDTPPNGTIVMTHQEAVDLMNTPNWIIDDPFSDQYE